jgi:hypothetical protein
MPRPPMVTVSSSLQPLPLTQETDPATSFLDADLVVPVH